MISIQGFPALPACGRDARGSTIAAPDSLSKAGGDQLCDGAGAMANPVLEIGVDFAKGMIVVLGDEYGVVAETALAPWRSSQYAMHLPTEQRLLAIRPGQRHHRDEVGLP